MVTHLDLDGDAQARYYKGSIDLKYKKNSHTSKSKPLMNTFIFALYQSLVKIRRCPPHCCTTHVSSVYLLTIRLYINRASHESIYTLISSGSKWGF